MPYQVRYLMAQHSGVPVPLVEATVNGVVAVLQASLVHGQSMSTSQFGLIAMFEIPIPTDDCPAQTGTDDDGSRGLVESWRKDLQAILLAGGAIQVWLVGRQIPPG